MDNNNVRNLRDLINSGEAVAPEKMLNVEDKEILARDGTELVVTSVAVGDDAEFGPFWEVKATINRDPVSFRVSHHPRRDGFMQALATLTAEGPISGVRLTAYPGRGGNSFIQLEPI